MSKAEDQTSLDAVIALPLFTQFSSLLSPACINAILLPSACRREGKGMGSRLKIYIYGYIGPISDGELSY